VVPVQWSPKGFTITQFDHGEVEALGLPKVDLLGIRALTVLAAAAKLVRRHYDPAFRIEDVPLTDELTATHLTTGDTIGVFQFESTGARRTLRQLKAHTVQDLAVANAFFKPGPATGGMAGSFIRRYRGEEAVTYLHPALAPILGPTQGVLIFQEQVLRVAHELAGLRWGEADELRKGMSKFQPAAMDRMKQRFVDGCQRPAPAGPAFSPQQAATLWEQVHAFAGYGFNQGHATAYADVSYRSAYLRAHYPAAFLAARLANYGGFHHPAIYIAEAQRLGMAVMPPHVNHSRRHFTLAFADGDHHRPQLWMGLGQVRSLRRRSVAAIMAERRKRPFADLDDLCHRVELQRKELTHLIQCGALDGLGSSRVALLADVSAGGTQRLQLTFAFDDPTVAAESAAERLRWEQRVLGQPVSVHPLQTVARRPAGAVLFQQSSAQPGKRVQVAVTRLPGWTGGKGYFVDDGEQFVVAIAQEKMARPKAWEPALLTGRWLVDEWGSGWFQVEAWTELH
jgi:DNA polymerase III alpha subunit